MNKIPQVTVTVGSGVASFDTDDLVAMFGVDKGKCIKLKSVHFRFGGINGFATIFLNRKLPLPQLVDGGYQNSAFILAATLALDIDHIYLHEAKITDTLHIDVTTISNVVTFDYELISGDMNWLLELTEVIPDVKQLSPRDSKSAGEEFFQAGDFNQVGV